MKRTILLISFFLVQITLIAQSLSLVKDIHSGSSSSSPSNFFAIINDTFYFSADDGVHGQELWKSDGTAAGTSMVTDITSGAGSSLIPPPALNTTINGIFYFRADDGVHGRELWKSDGTAAGTSIVKDIHPGSTGSLHFNFKEYVVVNNTLYFVADDGIHGRELWKSDGTATGTVMVKDINPGSSTSYIIRLINVNNTLYFAADDGIHGQELWKSDGTATGTVMVKDIYPGSLGGNPVSLVHANGVLYFSASDDVNGAELWKSDGTTTGTVMVKDIYPGNLGGGPASITSINGILYFEAETLGSGYELWKSDGTASGTVMLKDINPGLGDGNPFHFFGLNGIVYFGANNGTSGFELWKTDGTTTGTVMVKDINPGSGGSFEEMLISINGLLYFMAADGTTGIELWQTDGTTAGTTLVSDLNPGSGNSSPYLLGSPLNGTLYFAANDGSNGRELWKLPIPCSVTQQQLTINQCGGTYTVPSGNAIYTTSGIYNDTIMGNNGCDTILEINLAINQPSSFVQNIAECQGYSITVGNNTYTTTGIYTDTLTNNNNCDSIITTNLTIDSLPIISFSNIADTICNDVTVMNLIASPSGGTFTGNGVSSNTFTPSTANLGLNTITYSFTDGNNCTGIDSTHIYVDICAGLVPLNQLEYIKVYPNPTSGILHILLDKIYSQVDLQVVNTLGQIVQNKTYHNQEQITFSLKGELGIYFIRIKTNTSQASVLKVIKD